MSDQDRMDRAERIRRMREGRRGEDSDDDTPEDDADGTSDASASDDPTAQSDEPQTESATTATASGGAATTEPPEGEEDADAAESQTTDDTTDEGDGVEVDDVVAAAVERISGASASLPDTEGVDGEEVDGTSVDGDDPSDPAHSEVPEQEPEGTAEEDESTEGGETAGDEVTGDETPTDADQEPAGPAGIAGESVQTAAEETRVLEFSLADEHYCLDIEYIEEIVKHEQITRVPNTPAFVEGVVDLRGQITTILNPKIPIEKEETDPGDLIVVFDSEAFDEQGHLGWVVDDVRQVSPVTDGEVNHPPMDEDYIDGIIDRDEDEQFVIWTNPNLALDEAA